MLLDIGNLESASIGLTDKNDDNLIGHYVVSMYEYYEYKNLPYFDSGAITYSEGDVIVWISQDTENDFGLG